MNLNAAALRILIAKGMSLEDVAEFVAANEKGADNTNAERQARYRERRKAKKDNARYSNGVTPLNDNSLNPSSEAKASSPKFPAPDGVEESIWVDFLASPKRRKAGMNATAYAGIANNLKTLAENGFPPGEMIALAVERGWATVKLEWVKNDGQQRNQHHPNIGKTTAAIASLGGFDDHSPM